MSNELEQLKRENAELRAQIELLRGASINILSTKNAETRRRCYIALSAAVKQTPVQCLNEIQAAAGRAGFVAGVKITGDGYNYEWACHGSELEAKADQYAADIRAKKCL